MSVGRMFDVEAEGRGIQVASARCDASGLCGGRKLTFPRSGCCKGCHVASHRSKTMVKPQEGRKHDKRQQLVGYLKRFMRQPWFARLVIGVVWKLLDRFF